jgi:hypothetical protein
MIAVPFIDRDGTASGIWFRSRKGRKMALIAGIAAIVMTVGGVLLDEFMLAADAAGPPNVINNGLLPFAAILVFCGGFYLALKRVFKANHTEATQALFTLLLISFIVLTTIGVWFRGSGMQLMWAG